MKFKDIKLEQFYLRKAFFEYKKGFRYLYNKFYLSRKILKLNQPLEKPKNNDNYSIHILTSHKDLKMAIWALASLYDVSETIGQLYIHNDGSLKDKDQDLLKILFPSAKLLDVATFGYDYSKELEAYPILNEFRTKHNYFSFKKIIDTYFVADEKIHLIIDSDLLWFQKPHELEENIKNSAPVSYMQKNNVQIKVAYKEEFEMKEEFEWVNAGIILYNKDNYNIKRLERYLLGIDQNTPRSLHFVDQLGHAYCLENLELLDRNKYTIRGKVDGQVVAKHYTSPRRPLFYIEGLEILKDTIL